jgi:hypothetical protein
MVKNFAVLNIFCIGYLKRPTSKKNKSNINVDIWHHAVGLSCKNPPRHLCQLKAPLGVSIKGISRDFNWLKCLGGFLHLKTTVGCQISTLIFDFFYGCGVSINIPWKIYPKWSRTLPSLIYFSWDIYRDTPSIKKISNIKVDIWHPTVGLRCRIPPRHLSQLKARAIPLT